MFKGMWPKKKSGNTAAIGGAVSLAAILGGVITLYTARRMRRRGAENEFLYTQEEEAESQP